MSIVYKFDVLEKLKEAGYSTYRIRKDNLLAQGTMHSLRNKQPISWDSITAICKLLNCQPGDIMEYVENNEESATE